MAIKCRICSSKVVKKWTMKVRDRFEGKLMQCKECDALQFVGLDWLKDAYYGDFSVRFDEGRFIRNKVVYVLVRKLTKAFFDSDKVTLLDYGGGEGVLEDLLCIKAKPSYKPETYDPYVRKHSELPKKTFDFITCIEVLEHLQDVSAFFNDIKKIFHKDSIMLCSTSLYDPTKHDKKWQYLSTEIGQHITFWSKKSIRHLKKIIGVRHCAIIECNNKLQMQFLLFANRLPINVPDEHYELELL